ncbi:hypothetical protein BSPA111_19690 [Buttiauxella sp. A111]|nr:hypothetical protein BSPA111_19690 [Buttiauxella sp. A111]
MCHLGFTSVIYFGNNMTYKGDHKKRPPDREAVITYTPGTNYSDYL